MLFGWLFGAGVMAGGYAKNEWKRAGAKSDGKDMYTDISGIRRYTNSKLPYDRDYENYKKYGTFHPDLAEENNSFIKFCKKRINEIETSEKPDEVLIGYYHEHIEKEMEKLRKQRQFMASLDDLTMKRLRKQGYEI